MKWKFSICNSTPFVLIYYYCNTSTHCYFIYLSMWYILAEMRFKDFAAIINVIAIVVLCVDCACTCVLNVFYDCVLCQKWLNKQVHIYSEVWLQCCSLLSYNRADCIITPIRKSQGYVNAYSFMMTSSNGDIFRVTGHLCGEFTGPRWIPRTKVSDAELWCFLWSASA